MVPIEPEVDPADVGLDEDRLAVLGRHLDRYVSDRRLPGFLVVVTRAGKVAYLERRGFRDLEAQAPLEPDTRFRIYSMTKPITSVAAMICYEEGLIALDDPLSKFVPEFSDSRVFAGGSSFRPVTVPALEPIQIWHLMTHTSGLTYGWMFNHPVDAIYRSAGFEWGTPSGTDLAGCCERWSRLPLLCQPGTEWNYSVATDVLGRVVEVASGQPLDQFLAERVFAPLGMKETSFFVEGEAAGRLAALYTPDLLTGKATRADRVGEAALHPPSALLGRRGVGVDGGGLSPVHPDAAAAGRARRSEDPRRTDDLVHDSQPSARRRRHGPIRQSHRRPTRAWTRLRARILGRDRPGCAESQFEPRGLRLGRRCEHGILGRPGGGVDGLVLHPALAVNDLSGPSGTEAARLLGDRGLGG